MRRALPLLLVVITAGACASTRPPPVHASASTDAAPLPQPAPLPASTIAYPPAPRSDAADEFHGIKVADPYRPLEALEAPATRAWVAAENALTDAYFEHMPGREALHARMEKLLGYERFGVPTRKHGRSFWMHREARQDQPVVLTAASPDAPPTVLLDANTISPDGSLALEDFVASRDGARVAYGLSAGGGDWETFHVRDTASGRDLKDELPDVKYYQPAFTKDGKGLYYSRFPAPKPGNEILEPDHDCKVYFHAVGTDAARDVVIYERPDHPTWQFDPTVTDDGRYLVLTIGDGQVGDSGMEQIVYFDLAAAHPRPVPIVDTFESEYLLAGSEGPVLYFKTTLDAPRKRVIAIDTRAPARARWRTVVPEGENALEDASMVGHQLVLTSLKHATTSVAAYDHAGKKLRDVTLPGIGTAYGFRGAPEDKETYFAFTSFTSPETIYRYDLATGASAVWKAPAVAFDPEAFETKQHFYAAKDGTSVPMFVIAKKGLPLDGARPTLLTAYGFGGISMTPHFDPAMVAWMERGGILAVANVRGGGEYGEVWHQAATRERTQVKYDDFVSGAEWLIESKHTSAAHLGIFGRSGGGMLVAVVTIQRPELFAAVAPLAGVHDLLRFPLFGQGAGWEVDMGSPSDPAQFRALYGQSPLHNVRAGMRYPAMYIVTADHDVRVAPLHSYKLAAALQAAQAAPAPILLRVETTSGHGGGTTVSRRADQQTEMLGFFARVLGLDPS